MDRISNVRSRASKYKINLITERNGQNHNAWRKMPSIDTYISINLWRTGIFIPSTTFDILFSRNHTLQSSKPLISLVILTGLVRRSTSIAKAKILHTRIHHTITSSKWWIILLSNVPIQFGAIYDNNRMNLEREKRMSKTVVLVNEEGIKLKVW